jgi:hypothetical protein
MSANVLAHGAPETRLVHSDIPFKKTAIAGAVNSLLETRSYTVQAWDTLDQVQWALWVYLGQNLLLWVKWLVGQEIRVVGNQVFVPSWTSFRAISLSANTEQFKIPA